MLFYVFTFIFKKRIKIVKILEKLETIQNFTEQYSRNSTIAVILRIFIKLVVQITGHKPAKLIQKKEF